jgi:GNAT superfamily N-acetyltransferase
MIKTSNENFKIRFAKEQDINLILSFIKELAEYEKILDEVIATEEILYNSLFVKKAAEVIIGELNGKPVGFALFFHNFSTFIGKQGIYLEDLYIKPHARGKGFGKILLSYLGKLAIERNCGRIEWSCLDWNKPSIEFYKSLGAEVMNDWTVYRISGKSLGTLAKID